MTEEEAATPARSDATGGAWTPLAPWPLPDDVPPSDGTGPMPLEIERKFLVADDSWKREVVMSEHMRDGLITRFGEGKVRVRLTGSRAWLTIKSARKGIVRLEFEYEIPRADAEQMFRTLCQGYPVLEKVRHTVPFGGLGWTVDVYRGPLAGVVFAEVELEHPDQQLQLPPWVGEEVTNNPRFRKHALLSQEHAHGRGPIPPVA